jgi:hypothetical protein
MQFLIDRLAAIVERRASASPRACASGMVINTMGWVEGLGYELQLHAITALKVCPINPAVGLPLVAVSRLPRCRLHCRQAVQCPQQLHKNHTCISEWQYNLQAGFTQK